MISVLLPPCARDGHSGDWWKAVHKSCTGSHHVGPGDENLIGCWCECHGGPPRPKRPWPEELRERCLAAGYGDVFIGHCDVEAVDHDGGQFPGDAYAQSPHLDRDPAIWRILELVGVPRSSASSHWVGFDLRVMTEEQKEAIPKDARNWVGERWRDKHVRFCSRLSNQYVECRCAEHMVGCAALKESGKRCSCFSLEVLSAASADPDKK